MALKNRTQAYGWVSIALHWIMAVLVIGLYFLGEYIVDLSYYDVEYKTMPALHKSFGALMFLLLLMRIVWTLSHTRPRPATGASRAEVVMAKLAHFMIYILMIIIPLSGYLISTADGRPIEVFSLISIPAIETGLERQEELAGQVHAISASILMLLVVVHALAALKHHFINRDETLIRMFGKEKHYEI